MADQSDELVLPVILCRKNKPPSARRHLIYQATATSKRLLCNRDARWVNRVPRTFVISVSSTIRGAVSMFGGQKAAARSTYAFSMGLGKVNSSEGRLGSIPGFPLAIPPGHGGRRPITNCARQACTR